MTPVYIIGGLRSHIGLKNGIYRNISAEQLGAELLKKLGNFNADKIICGNGISGGGNITRLMSLMGDLNIPSVTVDSQCTSGLEAIKASAAEIAAGYSSCIICGGFESASTQPIREYNPNHPNYEEQLHGSGIRYYTAKFSPGEHTEDVMLRAAEKTAKHFNVTREETNRFVLESHRRAAASKDILSDLICPLFGSDKDEGIRGSMNERLINRLRPVVPNGNHVTAANSCLIHDGAAFLVLCSEEYMNKLGIEPLGKIIGFAETAVEPELAPYAAVKACRVLQERYNTKPDCIEVNEAFALIDVLMQRQFGDTNLNIFGGALAYGHPYGASGAVIMLHLLRALKYTNGKYGFAAAAAAGGLGCGVLVQA